VDDAGRVGVGEAFERLQHAVDDVLDRHEGRVRHLPEVAPVEVFHDEERRRVVHHAGVEDARHVRRLEPRRGPGFAQEPLDRLGVAGGLGEEHLDRHALAEDHVLGREDGRHAPGRHRAVDAVLAAQEVPRPGQDVAGLRRGRRSGGRAHPRYRMNGRPPAYLSPGRPVVRLGST
jgi:hypothetical protein